ncbi:MAG TPA: alpha/beta fold hydrolase [Actinomycetota bacterium]|nr:alpha/beta fold hydrolase [Actinomycetota bacterium]
MPASAYLAYAALGVVAVPALLGLWWVFATRKTDRSLIEAGPVRRLLRWYRALWLRGAAQIAAWPHLIELAFGAHRDAMRPTGADPVWQQDKIRVTRVEGSRDGPVVLVVHSFVSKPWILDLLPDRSFVGALAAAGFDTYLLDWGDFDRTDATRDLSYYASVLMRAEAAVLQHASAERLSLVGYCLGATLCLARLGARNHDHVDSAALVAVPGDFGVPSGIEQLMSHHMLKPAFLLDAASCVPAALVRESFHILRPQALRTVLAFVARRKDREFRRSYSALSRWIWEHRPLPGALFFDLVDLFRTNALLEGRLEVAGEIVRLSDIDTRVGVFVADRDHIVPSGSSHSLASVAGMNAEVFNFASGHVSMVSGGTAQKDMWPRLHGWIRSAAGTRRPASSRQASGRTTSSQSRRA